MARNLQDTMEYLYARWQDEKHYEDIREYGKVIEQELPAGFIFKKMSARPFGFTFEICYATYRLYMTSKKYTWNWVRPKD